MMFTANLIRLKISRQQLALFLANSADSDVCPRRSRPYLSARHSQALRSVNLEDVAEGLFFVIENNN
jgi:hypothetical protein